MDHKQALAIIRQTRDNYNKIAGHFSDTRHRVWPEFEYFKNYLQDGQNILDWGCGNGRLLLSLQEYRGIKYVGVDQSVELIKIARRTYREEIKMGRAKFYCNASKTPRFSSGQFDIAFMIASFFHLPDNISRNKLLKQVFRELKPGGKLIILVWNLGSDWAKAKAKTDWKIIGPNDFLIPWKTPQGKLLALRYYHHFTPEELRELFETSGFKIQKLEYTSGTWSDAKGGRNLVAVAEK